MTTCAGDHRAREAATHVQRPPRQLSVRSGPGCARGRADSRAGGRSVHARRQAAGLVSETRLVSAAAAGDELARELLIDSFAPRVRSIARRYRGDVVSEEELMQEGAVGLLCALERFQGEREVPFWAYASWWVRQAMQCLVADVTHPVVLSDRAFRGLARLHQAQRDLLQAHNRQPSVRELADRTGLSVDHIHQLRVAENRPRYLSEPVGDSDAPAEVAEQLADPASNDGYESVEQRQRREAARHLGKHLTDRERDILCSRYGIAVRQQTLQEVAARVGVTPERVRQIQNEALEKLRAELRMQEAAGVA